jgi:hypothetical protein
LCLACLLFGQEVTKKTDTRIASKIACFAVFLLSVAPARAQSTAQRQAHAARQAEIRRQNYARQEAVRLLLGPQGIPALTRPSDPLNYNRPRLYYQPNYRRYSTRLYYR